MKLVLLLSLPAAAAAWSNLFRGLREGGKLTSSVSKEDMNGCIANAEGFLEHPVGKWHAIEKAMDYCVMSKKVDDKNFVCPHYREILNAAFRREPTDRKYDAEGFCKVAETYVSELGAAARIPNMGKGDGLKFKLSKDCEPIVKASLAPAKTLASRSAPDFWYALCMNQDCAHFLPSRTRWCTVNHQPTHSAAVCEAVRLFARDETSIFGSSQLEPKEVCNMYDEFVEDSYIEVEAYMHVTHGKKHKKVPVPEDRKRALSSSAMKNEAKKHGIRDGSGIPVEVKAPVDAAGKPIDAEEPAKPEAKSDEEPLEFDPAAVPGRTGQTEEDAHGGRVIGQLIFGILYYLLIVKHYPSHLDLPPPSEDAKALQAVNEISATTHASMPNLILSYCCTGPRAAHTFYSTLGFNYWAGCILMSCFPCCTLWVFNSFTKLNQKLGGEKRNAFKGLLCACLCSCCVVAQDAETLDRITGYETRLCSVRRVK